MSTYIKVSNNELYHHGILGQKWGKRNGPPYPLNYSDHSAAEKKHLTKEKKTIKDQKYRDKEIQKTTKYGYGKDLKLTTKLREGQESRKAKLQTKYENEYNNIRSKAKTDEEKDIKLHKLDDKYSKKLQKTDNTIERLKNEEGYYQELLDSEIANIRVMDISADKKAYGKIAASAAIQSLAGLAIASVTGFGFITTPAKGSRPDRLSKEEKQAIADRWLNDKKNESEVKELSVMEKFDNANRKTSSRFTSEQKSQAMAKAKSNNVYQLNFLEAIQNSKILYDNNTAAINKEYSKYLDDPDGYWEEARKLDEY